MFVPTKEYPEYNFVGRILGPRGMTAKQLETETGCKIMVRGKGSMRDKKKVGFFEKESFKEKNFQEDANRGKPNWEHLNEELHVLIQCEDASNRIDIKIRRAREEVNKLLVPSVSFLLKFVQKFVPDFFSNFNPKFFSPKARTSSKRNNSWN